MDKLNVIKIAGIIIMVTGVVLLIAGGVILSNKFVAATGFIGCIIAVILLYYAWRMEPMQQYSERRE